MRARIVAMFGVPTVEGSPLLASSSPAGLVAVAGSALKACVSSARALARVIATPTPFSTETLLSLMASLLKLTRFASFLGVSTTVSASGALLGICASSATHDALPLLKSRGTCALLPVIGMTVAPERKSAAWTSMCCKTNAAYCCALQGLEGPPGEGMAHFLS
jgi:hypothetical protein